jgi:hypothetical protein
MSRTLTLTLVALVLALSAFPGAAGATGHEEDTTPPSLHLPGDFTTTTWDPGGAYVWYWAEAWDDVDGVVPVSCAPATGTLFPVGTTRVECTATDDAGNVASGGFDVLVELSVWQDTSPPYLYLWDQTVHADGPSGATFFYYPYAWDDVDGTIAADCAPESGSVFPVGATTVSCTATDAAGNVASGSFVVTVLADEPPTLQLPGDITVDAWSTSGAYVWYSASAWDDRDMYMFAPTCIPASGNLFPVGTTTVTCTATDSGGNTTTGSFTVTVRPDETPPTLTLHPPSPLEAADETGAVVSYWAYAWDTRDGMVTPVCSPASGSRFAVGTTTVTCTATDSWGNSGSGSFEVVVRPPLVITVTITRGSVNTVTGVATIEGTIECSQGGGVPLQPTSVSLSGKVTQRLGRTLINGHLTRVLACSTPRAAWSAETADSNGLFVTGSADVTVTATRAHDVMAGLPFRSGSAEATMRLKSAR